MTRKKVKLAYIIDDNARKATFKKRKKGIVKKVSELTILCGIDACAIISNPYDSQAEVWPNPKGAKHIIKRYLKTPVIDETKNMNQERFIMQKISKALEKLDKQLNENREKQIALAMFECMEKRRHLENLTIGDLKDMDKLIVNYMKDIKSKIHELV
ncbi:hypothetical protein TanjilG_02699 [Lupinus angustifolius]|uniref:MADS-box domain-containing protein n=1 Tax=Lupinus angustifolius TaxID=3871 RepID=A0A4P1RBI1_LUPAN|nr:PREDICTED: agamous-like MADS-box protein AGL80 [Lupinus angustifolius]OIW07065.1 hypothetical protein TanjilG_02699 [Lupinus angustifolius]